MEATTHRQEKLIDFAMLAIMVAVVYGRILGHDFLINWDDNWCVLYDESIRGFSWGHLRKAFTSDVIGSYVPVETVSYMLDYTLWGLRAGGFLLTNIILHAINGLLVYRLVIRWYGERLSALVTAALFLLHPVQVESVAWITQRRLTLAMLFFLLAWEAYCRYRESAPGKGRLAYAASVAAFVLALLSKSITVIFPVVLVLYDLCFPEGGRRLRLKDKIPFILAAGVIAVATLNVHSQWESEGTRMDYPGGSPVATFFTMLSVFCRYLGMVVWPSGLSAIYAPTIHHSFDATVAMAAFLLAMVTLSGVWLFRRDRRLGFWVLVFWIGLLPVSQIVPISFIMSDRYLYFPMLGVAALAGAGATVLRDRLGPGRRWMLYLLLALPLVALSVASFQRAGAWRNPLTLWSDATAKVPASDRAWELLGETYRLSGNKEAAFQAYGRGLDLNPANTEILYGLGEMYTGLGELDKGAEFLEKLLRIKPDYAVGWAALGNNYQKRSDYPAAEKAYRQALAIQPDAMQVVAMLGNLALAQGHLDEARSWYGQIEAKGWNDPAAAYQLACIESEAGHRDEALNWLEKALQRGYNDYGKLVGDRHLSAIRGEPRFDDIVRRYAPK
ncbi:tetratricopeptide repeat protein [Geobacter sp. AOG1]|uniref:tetratricopeptide repeat protein n=1 Tax=Geobacter sp. AOG1 TaxID=1566346 RepID=UPI001CC5D94F|nr:tetratricopeptide repeat protein [Geobacter sp. AOG1]GFE56439.1 O-GlcNAc transferase [Geobacter sp. AOG1]